MSDLSELKVVTAVYEMTDGEENTYINVTVEHGINNVKGFALQRIVGSSNTNSITWYAMTATNNFRFYSNRVQTVTAYIMYFY